MRGPGIVRDSVPERRQHVLLDVSLLRLWNRLKVHPASVSSRVVLWMTILGLLALVAVTLRTRLGNQQFEAVARPHDRIPLDTRSALAPPMANVSNSAGFEETTSLRSQTENGASIVTVTTESAADSAGYEARYAGLSKAMLEGVAADMGEKRVRRMLELTETRVQAGRFEVRGFLAPGEKTPLIPKNGPLLIERLLPTGEYQVIEFLEMDYPIFYASKREEDWLLAASHQRQ